MKKLSCVLISVIITLTFFTACSKKASTDVGFGQVSYYGNVYSLGNNASDFKKAVDEGSVISITDVNGGVTVAEQPTLDTILHDEEKADVDLLSNTPHRERADLVFTVENNTGEDAKIKDLPISEIIVFASSFDSEAGWDNMTEEVFIFGGIDCSKKTDFSSVDDAIANAGIEDVTAYSVDGANYMFTAGDYSYIIDYSNSDQNSSASFYIYM